MNGLPKCHCGAKLKLPRGDANWTVCTKCKTFYRTLLPQYDDEESRLAYNLAKQRGLSGRLALVAALMCGLAFGQAQALTGLVSIAPYFCVGMLVLWLISLDRERAYNAELLAKSNRRIAAAELGASRTIERDHKLIDPAAYDVFLDGLKTDEQRRAKKRRRSSR